MLPGRLTNTTLGAYRKLTAAGKPAPEVVVAIARELVGFIWAIARMVEPKFA